MQHSKIVGSSTAARRLACPGSIDLEAGIPEPPESTYAAEGTALHEAMELVVGEDISPSELLGETFYGHQLDDEQVEALHFCLAAFEEVTTPGDELDVERTVAFPGIPGAFGTGDVCWFRPHLDDERFGAAGIVDWKFGAGVPVFAPGNKQGMFLLAGLRAGEEMITRQTRLYITFVQPRLDYKETVEITHAELDAFERDLRHALNVRRYAEGNLATGSHCKFCKAILTCPAKQAEAREAVRLGKMARDDLPKALAMADSLEDWIKEVRAAAHHALEQGHNVQGWKLVAKRANRQWDPELTEEEIEKRLARRFKLLKGQRRVSKLISPAQAEKLVGKGKVDDMVRDGESSGTTLAPETDKRPAVQQQAATLGNLFSAISNATKKEAQ